MSRVAALLRRGLEAFNAGRHAEAAEAFAQARRDGGGAQAACFLAHSLEAAGRPDEALAALRSAVKLDPRHVASRLALAELLRRRGRPREGLALLEAAAAGGGAVRRALVEALVLAARAAKAEDRRDAAGRAWARVLELDRRHEEAREELRACRRTAARAALGAGRPAAARALLEAALELSPRDADTRAELARALRAEAAQLEPLARLEEARDRLERSLTLDRAVETEGALSAVLRRLAEREESRGRWARARALWRRADALAPSPERAAGERFRALVRAGRYAEAIAEGERLLDRGATLWDLRAFWAPWDVGRLDKVRARDVAALDAVLARDPDQPWALYYRGFLRGGDAGAADFARLARADEARYGWMHGRAGQSLAYLGRLDEGVARLKRALRWRVADWRLRGYLAEALLAQGRETQALAQLERARGMAPREELGQVLAWRSRILRRLGRAAEARRDMRWARALGAPEKPPGDASPLLRGAVAARRGASGSGKSGWRAHALLAEKLVAQGLDAEADAQLERARERAPKGCAGEALAWQARLDLWRGRAEEALKAARWARSLGAPEADLVEGAALRLLGRHEEALAALEDCGDREARVWRAEALRALGKPREALDAVGDGRQPWETVARALAHADLGDEAALAREFARVPRELARRGALACGAGAPATAEARAAALEAAVKLARGWRRGEGDGWAPWMR